MMALVDTSIWVDHLRDGDPALSRMLDDGQVLMHPFIVGELALGGLRQRRQILDWLIGLPTCPVATHDEALGFIDRHALDGAGVGYVDAHLLAAVRLEGTARLWTRDKRLAGVARRLGVAP